jgi:hypothetical protein
MGLVGFGLIRVKMNLILCSVRSWSNQPQMSQTKLMSLTQTCARSFFSFFFGNLYHHIPLDKFLTFC